ncbi:MAG TPA: N-acetyl-gamma-glutamyl-phosphate reductase [Fimbriimonadaceae bacterium]|jgi:N-acetyl-gamma-glutamyl-phosphate reductase
MIKVGIVGASGYGGGELLRWFANHPEAKVVAATSKTYAGEPIGKAFGSLAHSDLTLSDDDLSSVAGCDVVFLGASDDAAMCMAGPLLKAGAKVIDLSASFRFRECDEYARWYKSEHKAATLNAEAIYGLPELHREEIKSANLIGNPGCYVTASILALAPAAKAGLLDLNSIIINGISGVSGAGRSKFCLDYHFSEMNESAWAYKVGGTHRHTGEIEQELKALAGEEFKLTFTPHIVPMTRGVLATCYGSLKSACAAEEVKEIYKSFYKAEPFVQVLDGLPITKHTVGSNHCHIGLAVDERTNRLIVVSAIDNLGKGMAGQAIQNMNLMFGLPETTGLQAVALWP